MVTSIIKSHTFNVSEPGPHLLITAGVHGDEFEPIRAVQTLLNQLQNKSDNVSGFRGTVTLVPCVNEAAFFRGHRCAEDGLDLARTCPGSETGSITERTAFELSQLIATADYYIDLHTGGTEYSLYPLAGYMLHADPEILKAQRRMAHAFNLPVVWGTSPHLDGRSLSVARDACVPAIYIEYNGAATCTANGTRDCVDGCLNVMAELGMLTRTQPDCRVRHVVEDPKPDSGHLQVCNPSPVTGVFEPNVALGDLVTQGDPLGTVFPINDGEATPVHSEGSGLVILLRTFPRVKQGESVAVVLELP